MNEFSPQVLALTLSLGIVFSLVCYLLTNLSPGGMISPAWLAILLVEDARRAFIVVGVVVVTCAVMFPLQKIVILYGKRLFATVVLIAVFAEVTVSLFLIDMFPTLFATTTLGFIVPGLVAYQLIRQPPVATVIAMGTITALTWAVLISGVLLDFIPTA